MLSSLVIVIILSLQIEELKLRKPTKTPKNPIIRFRLVSFKTEWILLETKKYY